MQFILHSRRLAAPVLLALASLAAAPAAWAARTQEANVLPVLQAAELEGAPRQLRTDLLLGTDDNIYFATVTGGNGTGAVGRLTPDGVLTTLYAFKGDGTEGLSAFGRLMQDTRTSDGDLYGTTYLGGAQGLGTLFRLALDGTFTVLHNFGGGAPNAALPYTGVTLGPDGFLYGTTHNGGDRNKGTVYRIATDGTDYSVIHHFAGGDGENPQGALVVGADGLLYGTTLVGGDGNRGTLYRISTTGAHELMYSFPRAGGFGNQGLFVNATGANPRAGLMLSDLDGNFYGTAYQGGEFGNGTLFRMTPAGDVSVVHAFTGPSFGGSLPMAGVTQDVSGNFYGTTSSGGYLRGGSAWRVAPDGTFSMLHGFAGPGAASSTPQVGVLLAHGTVYTAGQVDWALSPGAIMKLDLGSGGILPLELSVSAVETMINESVTVSWNAPVGTTCRKIGGPLGWPGDAETTGSAQFTPLPGTYVFALSCTDPDDGDETTPELVRNAQVLVIVRTPPLQPLDGGGGTGSPSLLWLLLMAALLSPKVIKETLSPMSVATATSEQIRALLANASIEMTCKDTEFLAEAATLVPKGTDIFIALFPNQTWDDLTTAARAVGEAGFNAVPHVPCRRIKDAAEVAEIARKLTQVAGAKKMLLIAGDMPSPEGAFDSTIGVLETGSFARAGIRTFYMAGHPEGHAHMTADQQRQFEARKVALSKEQGFELKFTTQVCFEAEPIIAWEKTMRASGITNTIRPGLGGPASIKTLLRYAKICGAGASIRALTSGKASLIAGLLKDSGPEEVVTRLAAARGAGSDFESVHLFAFGGFLKTTKWVSAVQNGRFEINQKDGDFTVQL